MGADCGAGIGRTAKGLLIKDCERVELLEQDARFLERAREELGTERTFEAAS